MSKRWIWLIGIAAAVLLAAGLLAAWGLSLWRQAPRLLEVAPVDGAQSVGVRASLRLRFSQPLRPISELAEALVIEPPQDGQLGWLGDTLVFTPTRPWPGGAVIRVAPGPGLRASASGLPVIGATSWSFETSQRRLAYLWPAYPPADVYALDPDSGEVSRLTYSAPAGVLDFSLSADGSQLYYSAGGTGQSALLRLTLDAAAPVTTSATLLTCRLALCRGVVASPDGRWLAYERAPGELASSAADGLTQVWLLDLVSGLAQPAGPAENTTAAPVWSPQGWLTYYDRSAQAYVILDPTGRAELARIPNQTGKPAAWSQIGNALAVAELLLTGPPGSSAPVSGHILHYPLADPAVARLGRPLDLTETLDLEDADPVFSPDGRWLAIGRRSLHVDDWTPGRQLWLLSTDGRQAYALTDDAPYRHYDFAWSADGAQLAFVRFNQTSLTDAPELWIMQSDGSNAIQLVLGAYAPLWLP